MSYATAVLWGWNFIVALTFPRLLGAFKPQGAFSWYAGCESVIPLLARYMTETDIFDSQGTSSACS